ncbi:hypothetical protein KFE25_004407, partial [Diacronema lutheri]
MAAIALLAALSVPDVALPEVALGDLVAGKRAALAQLRVALVEVGAAVVTDVPSLGHASAGAFAQLASCSGGRLRAGEFRRTVAARVLGGVASQLDMVACARALEPLRRALGRATDAVVAALDADADADADTGGGRAPGGAARMRRVGGGEYAGLRALVHAGEQLEHFHLYPVGRGRPAGAPARGAADAQRVDGGGAGALDEGEWTMPLHTDGGLFAVMTAGFYVELADGLLGGSAGEEAGRSSHGAELADGLRGATGAARQAPADLAPRGAGLYIRLRDGRLVRAAQSTPLHAAEPPRSEVIVLAGEGAARWLERRAGAAPFRPAPHALLVGSGGDGGGGDGGGGGVRVARAWHGRMLLPPSDALLPSGLTFQAHREAEAAAIAAAPLTARAARARAASGEAPAAPAACSTGGALPPGRAFASASRRQLTAVAGGGDECVTGSGTVGVRCWMLCVDPSALGCATDATVACIDSSTGARVNGSDHCPTGTPPSPPSDAADAAPRTAATAATTTWLAARPRPFCSGPGVSMYMQGFASLVLAPRTAADGNALPPAECVVLFAPSAVLDTAPKMAAGCLALALLGLAVELLASARRAIGGARRL